MELFEQLVALGVDVDSAMARFMGNAQLLEMMYKKVPDSLNTNSDIIPHIDAGDISQAIQKTHTLKGNMGNLSITPLFEAYTEIVNDLRAGNTAAAKEKLIEVKPVQDQIMAVIKKY